jgi:hypothetical protein
LASALLRIIVKPTKNNNGYASAAVRTSANARRMTLYENAATMSNRLRDTRSPIAASDNAPCEPANPDACEEAAVAAGVEPELIARRPPA